MNHNQDIAYNSLKIISNEESYNKNSGCLILNGGVACKKSINAHTINADIFNADTINANTIENLDKALFKINSLSINKLDVENIHKFNSEECTVNYLLPKEYNSKIGLKNNRFDIFSNLLNSNFGNFLDLKASKLNVNNDTYISKDYNNKYMISTNSEESILNLNCDILTLNGNLDKIEITDDGIENDGLIIYNYLDLKLTECDNIIYPLKSLIFISSSDCKDIILSNLKNQNEANTVKEGSYVKVINLDKINLYINNLLICTNDNLEFIYIKDKWLCISKLTPNFVPRCNENLEMSLNNNLSYEEESSEEFLSTPTVCKNRRIINKKVATKKSKNNKKISYCKSYEEEPSEEFTVESTLNGKENNSVSCKEESSEEFSEESSSTLCNTKNNNNSYNEESSSTLCNTKNNISSYNEELSDEFSVDSIFSKNI